MKHRRARVSTCMREFLNTLNRWDGSQALPTPGALLVMHAPADDGSAWSRRIPIYKAAAHPNRSMTPTIR